MSTKYPNKRSSSSRPILKPSTLTVSANAYVRVSPGYVIIPVDADGVSNPDYSANDVAFDVYKDNQLEGGWGFAIESTSGCDAAIALSPNILSITNVTLAIAGVLVRCSKTDEQDILFEVRATLLSKGEQGIQGDPGVGNWQGAWLSGNYTVGDIVEYLGSTYYCKLNTVSNEIPTDTTYWDLSAAKGDKGDTGDTGDAGTDGEGWTGGSYNTSTGIVTFTSDDGLGFATSDLRGADGTSVFPAGFEEHIDPVDSLIDASDESNYLKMYLSSSFASTSRYLTIPTLVNFTAILVDVEVDIDAPSAANISVIYSSVAGNKLYVQQGERFVAWFIKNGTDVDVLTIYDSTKTDDRIEGYNGGLKQEIVEINDWDMVTDSSFNIAYSSIIADYEDIRCVTTLIRNDTDTARDSLEGNATAIGAKGSIQITSTDIQLNRDASGIFDDAAYSDDDSYVRGWAIIHYV